jgi:hypothetical protein
MRALAGQRRRFGYRHLHVLQQEGLVVNRKRAQRLFREEGLMVRRRRSRKWAPSPRVPLIAAALPNTRWSLDFVHDQLACGRGSDPERPRRRHQGAPRGRRGHLDLGQKGCPRVLRS